MRNAVQNKHLALIKNKNRVLPEKLLLFIPNLFCNVLSLSTASVPKLPQSLTRLSLVFP